LSSGTAALHLGLRALGVGPGDEVITVPNTYVATVFAITYVGALPVFVDVDPATANIDPARVAAAVTERTKAILPVHMYGACVDVDALRVAAPGIPILEDAAHAHGATYKGRKAGSLGELAEFSFYPAKVLGALGDGGALTTSDPELDARSVSCATWASAGRSMSNLSRMRSAWTSSRPPSRVKPAVEARLRAAAAARHRDWLADAARAAGARPVGRHAYTCTRCWRPDREAPGALDERASDPAHLPKLVPDQGAYAEFPWRAVGDLEVARSLVPRLLCLPMFAELTDDEVDRVGLAVREFYGVA
jgi:dTDP-4-amino-4,6-dideoxygalactose transaminase